MCSKAKQNDELYNAQCEQVVKLHCTQLHVRHWESQLHRLSV